MSPLSRLRVVCARESHRLDGIDDADRRALADMPFEAGGDGEVRSKDGVVCVDARAVLVQQQLRRRAHDGA